MSKLRIFLPTFLILAVICSFRSCQKAEINREQSAKNVTSKIIVQPVDFEEYKNKVEQEGRSK